ncbi:MAG: hypothetical protein RJA98_1166, partial [Pseudomonadota bacterium]
MADLILTLTTPQDGTAVERAFRLAGRLVVAGGGRRSASVRVQVGDNGPSLPATVSANNWQCDLVWPAHLGPGQALTLTAFAQATVKLPGRIDESLVQDLEAETSLTLRLAAPVPAPAPSPSPAPAGPSASTVFLPWVRQGLASQAHVVDPLTAPLPSTVDVQVALGINGGPGAEMTVRLSGAAEVIGTDPRQVVRTEPAAGASDFEPNHLVAIDFDNPDLPWLFTPAAANAQGQLRPWLCLVVVRQQDGVRLRAPRDELLPVLELRLPARLVDELPDLDEAWAWAHGQVSARQGASEEVLRELLQQRPELCVSRLLCPRLLAPNTDYIACVVPTFEAGRLAALGLPLSTLDEQQLRPAWRSSTASTDLPAYHHWTFRTGERSDFASLIDLLQLRDLPDGAGLRPIDVNQPGYPLSSAQPTLALEGALQAIGQERTAWPETAQVAFQAPLQDILNASAGAHSAVVTAQGDGTDPVWGPPIYGQAAAGRNSVSGSTTAPSWLDDLNLDPRDRAVAAAGTRVVQDAQEALVAQAWAQAGEMGHGNQQLRQMQLSLNITTQLYQRHVVPMRDEALWRLAGPAQSRLLLPEAGGGTSPVTLSARLQESSAPDRMLSAPLRRLARPRGPIARRAKAAVGAAATPATAATVRMAVTEMGTLFHFFGTDAVDPQWLLPTTRGWVSLDTVSRRTPATASAITWANASAGAVLGAPQRPGFRIGPAAFNVLASHIGVFQVFANATFVPAAPAPSVQAAHRITGATGIVGIGGSQQRITRRRIVGPLATDQLGSLDSNPPPPPPPPLPPPPP